MRMRALLLICENNTSTVLAGYLGANFMCGPINEWQIDNEMRATGEEELTVKGSWTIQVA